MSFVSEFSSFRPTQQRPVLAHAARVAGFLPSIARTFVLGACLMLPLAARAQGPGSLDTSFLSAATESSIFSVAIQYNGADVTENILAGGDAATLLDLDGTGLVMGTFEAPPFGSQDRITYTIVPELVTEPGATSPYFLVGGLFGKSKQNNVIVLARNILRITVGGLIDTTFNPGLGADDFVTSILPQADGTIFVGGQFIAFNGKSYQRLVRLNQDGSINADFQSLPVGDSVFSLAAQIDPTTGKPNGQVLLGGDFSNIGSATYTKLARIDQNGNLDASFKPVIDDRVLTVVVQPDGKIVIGGQFSMVNGQAVGHLARLNQDGTLDPTFSATVSGTPALTTSPVAVYTLNLLPDGRFYVGGNFTAVDGVTRNYLALIESDGTLETDFDPGTVITNSVQTTAVQNDNRLLVGETVTKKVNNNFPPSLVRLFGVTSATDSKVKLTVPEPKATEGQAPRRKTGTFRFKRVGGDTSSSLTVYFNVTGTAQSGVAYRPLDAEQYAGTVYRVTFAPTQKVIRLKISPRHNPLPVSPETVTVALLPSPDFAELYNVAPGAAGTVTIRNAN